MVGDHAIANAADLIEQCRLAAVIISPRATLEL